MNKEINKHNPFVFMILDETEGVLSYKAFFTPENLIRIGDIIK